MRRSVYCTASFSICSLRRAKFPIIYPSFGSTTKLQHIQTSAAEVARLFGLHR